MCDCVVVKCWVVCEVCEVFGCIVVLVSSWVKLMWCFSVGFCSWKCDVVVVWLLFFLMIRWYSFLL